MVNTHRTTHVLYTRIELRYRMTSFHVDQSLHDDKGKIKSRIDCIVTYLEENRQNIFYLFVFYVITIALFVNQFICKLSFPVFFFWLIYILDL